MQHPKVRAVVKLSTSADRLDSQMFSATCDMQVPSLGLRGCMSNVWCSRLRLSANACTVKKSNRRRQNARSADLREFV